ncbi:MAG: efflux RND transporter periplasmic adaptor subunit [Syntrophomonadaceae bacterium]|nr:efflux RND transporter periplasmic adaptor subunit [Syntrophomonadaceae bacterium]
MQKKTLGALAGIIIVAGIIYSYSTAGIEVETAEVIRGEIELAVVDTGYVQASNQADIYATQGGRVASLPVSVGQNVAKDQIIAVLDNKDLSMGSAQLQVQLSQAHAAVSAAEAALTQSNLDLVQTQAQYDRSRELFDSGAISQVEYDNAQALLDKTQAGIAAQEQGLKAAREQVANYQGLLNNSRQKESELQIKSPISGVVMQLPVRQGDVVMYGSPLAKVAPPGTLEIKVDILSDDLGQIKVGNKVEITAPVLEGEVLIGEVVQIYPQAEEKQSAFGVVQRRVPARIKLADIGNLKPGYETMVSIITGGKENILLIPREAVTTSPDGSRQVMVIVNDRAVVRKVSTGLFDARSVEITEGLEAGDQIVRDGGVSLKANARVKVQKA